MPSSGDGTAWAVTIPTDSDSVADGPVEIREIKKAVELRLNKEHTSFATSSAGGEHKAGSAKAYFQTTFPTQRPDAATNFTLADSGRLLVRSDTGGFYYFDHAAATWKPTVLVDVASIADGLITAAKMASGSGHSLVKYAVVIELQANTTAGGTFTSGDWRTRTLNQELYDADGIVTVSSNQFTLAAGTYRIKISAPASQVDGHVARLYNITDASTVVSGTSGFSANGIGWGVNTRSEVYAEFTLADAKAFEVQHRCGTTKSGNGFGVPASIGSSEIYTVVEIWKLV